jgi:hypothetical protein
MNKYITLTEYGSSKLIAINSIMVCTIKDDNNYRIVTTMDGSSFNVVETTEAILKQINDANNITLITK